MIESEWTYQHVVFQLGLRGVRTQGAEDGYQSGADGKMDSAVCQNKSHWNDIENDVLFCVLIKQFLEFMLT